MDIAQASTSTLVAIRAAHHPETTPQYDRVVFEFKGPVPLIQVEYVKQLFGDGSGLPVPIIGKAILHLRFAPTQAHTDAGQSTAPGHMSLGLPIVKEIVSAGDFEGVVNYGIGLDHKAELRVITLDAPSRVVIDIM